MNTLAGNDLECRGLVKAYDGTRAVDGVDLVLRTGQITAIVGANGAGKTTLLDIISGTVPATEGTVHLGGRNISGLSPWRRARLGILRCFQDARLFPEFTVREALTLAPYRTHKYDIASGVLRLPHAQRRDRQVASEVAAKAAAYTLGPWLDTPLRQLSLGMVKVVQLALTMIAEPDWTLLDEPAAGLARAEVNMLGDLLRRMNNSTPDRSRGILLVEHDALLVSSCCDRVVVMAGGRVADDILTGDSGWDDLLHATAPTGADIKQATAAYSAASARTGGAGGATAGGDRDPAATQPAASVPRAVPEGRLEASNLTISYGRFTAVSDVSVDVRPGRMAVLVGTNGAGKSSVLNTIVGLKSPTAGEVRLDGKDLRRLSPHHRSHLGVVLIPSGRALLGSLTVAENLKVPSPHQGECPIDDYDPLDLFPELRSKLRQRAGTMSGGEQQMLAIARGMRMRPRFLLMDELSLGLSAAVIERLMQALHVLRDAGLGLLVVEQNTALALEHSDHAFVINKGKMAFDGPSAEAAQRTELFRAVFIQSS
jgi:branched-chain amino acid transport system ATP-binding protein